jgi:hypothetical protein
MEERKENIGRQEAGGCGREKALTPSLPPFHVQWEIIPLTPREILDRVFFLGGMKKGGNMKDQA